MAIAAGIVGEGLIGTVVTLFQMAAEGGGATAADVGESLALLARKYRAPAGEELLLVSIENIGQL